MKIQRWTHAQPIDPQHLNDGITVVTPLGDSLDDEQAAAEAQMMAREVTGGDWLEDPYEEPVFGQGDYTHIVAVGHWYCDGRICDEDMDIPADFVYEQAWLVRK